MIVSTIRAIYNGEDDKAIVEFVGISMGFALVTAILATAFFPTNVKNAISDEKLQLIEDIKWIDENVKPENKQDMIKEKVTKYNKYLSSSLYDLMGVVIYFPFYRTSNGAELTKIDIDSITMDNYIELILESGKEIK